MILTLDNAGKLTTIFASLVIMHSVIYDWLYLTAIDVEVFKFMTLTDHITSGIEHIPELASVLFMFGFIVVVSDLVNLRRGSPLKFNVNVFVVLANIAMLILFTFACYRLRILNTMSYQIIFFLSVFPIVSAFLFSVRLTVHGFGYQESARIALFFNILSIVILSGAILGTRDAKLDLSGIQKSHNLTTSTNETLNNATILRSMQRGVLLLMDESRDVLFLPWNQINKIDSKAGPRTTS